MWNRNQVPQVPRKVQSPDMTHMITVCCIAEFMLSEFYSIDSLACTYPQMKKKIQLTRKKWK